MLIEHTPLYDVYRDNLVLNFGEKLVFIAIKNRKDNAAKFL